MELHSESPASPIPAGIERKFQFLYTLDHRKILFSNPAKYSIINTFARFTPFCYSYSNPLGFVSFLHKSQQSFFFRKTGILVKTRNITCLLTANKCLHQLLWVDCAIVELSQKKKEVQYQDVFYIKPWLFRPNFRLVNMSR